MRAGAGLYDTEARRLGELCVSFFYLSAFNEATQAARRVGRRARWGVVPWRRPRSATIMIRRDDADQGR